MNVPLMRIGMIGFWLFVLGMSLFREALFSDDWLIRMARVDFRLLSLVAVANIAWNFYKYRRRR